MPDCVCTKCGKLVSGNELKILLEKHNVKSSLHIGGQNGRK